MKTQMTLIVALVLIPAGLMSAGELEPPSALAPTMKTLSQVEPRIPINDATTPGTAGSTYEISASGSYYLTEDVVGEAGKFGLIIHVPNVSIDLNGFSLVGGPGMTSNSEPGIFVEAGATAVVIHNGTIARWSDGIVSDAASLTVHDVQCVENGNDGLRAGPFSEVRGGHFRGNLSDGVDLGSNSRVVGVRASENNYGIVVGGGSLIRDCIAEGNTNHGIRVIGPGSRVESCVATNNNNGISIDADRCTVVNNTSTGNAWNGIQGGEIATTYYSHCVFDGNHDANLEPGQHVIISIDVGPQLEPVAAKAEIVRKTDPEREGIEGIGAQFLSFAGDSRKTLETVLGDAFCIPIDEVRTAS